MEGISDIKIVGFDDNRPPLIRKEPYIELFFKLTHQAPDDWCTDFNQLTSKADYSAKINPKAGLFIESWVRKPEEIAVVLEKLKAVITTCSEQYIEKINAAISAASNTRAKPGDEGEQGRLNRIVAALTFD